MTDIHTGRVVFSAPATRGSLLADNYKQRHVQVYDVHSTGWLDHYRYGVCSHSQWRVLMQFRLRVPRYRNILEFVDFGVLLFLYVLFINSKRGMYILVDGRLMSS